MGINDGQFQDFSGRPLGYPGGVAYGVVVGSVPKATDYAFYRDALYFDPLSGTRKFKDTIYGYPSSDPAFSYHRVMHLETYDYNRRTSESKYRYDATYLAPYAPTMNSGPAWSPIIVPVPVDSGPAMSGLQAPTTSDWDMWNDAFSTDIAINLRSTYSIAEYYLSHGRFDIEFERNFLTNVLTGNYASSRILDRRYYSTEIVHTYNPPQAGKKWEVTAVISQPFLGACVCSGAAAIPFGGTVFVPGSMTATGTFSLYLIEFGLTDDFLPLSITYLSDVQNWSMDDTLPSNDFTIATTVVTDFLTLPVRWALAIGLTNVVATPVFGTSVEPIFFQGAEWVIDIDPDNVSYRLNATISVAEVPI